MAAVYVSNLVINTGSTFSQTFTLEATDTNSPMNLTGYTVASQMRKWAGASKATDFTAEIGSPATDGKITLGIGATVTADLKPGRYVYDVVVDISGTKETVVEGTVIVREGVTR